MKSKKIIPAVILLLVLLIFATFKWHLWEPQKERFNRHPAHMVYTHHAQCRMDCRHISKEDINEIMLKGSIRLNKTNLYDKPCPTYALEGYTSDHEDIRVIFAQCDTVTKVVTCYNLHREFVCDCPGDH